MGRAARLRAAAVTAGIALVAALLLMRHVLADPATHEVAGNPNDTDQFVWWLTHTAWALRHGHNIFLATNMNEPTGVNLLWNTSLILPGIVMAPVTTVFGGLASYNVLVVASLATTAGTTHLLLRRYVAREGAARLGGLMWAFSPAILGSELGHLNLVLAPLLPPILGCVDELIRGTRRPWRVGVGLGVLVALQILIGEELLFETGLLLVVVGVVAGLLHPRSVWRAVARGARAVPSAVAVLLVLDGYPLYLQFLGPLRQHGGVYPASIFETDLKSLFVPSGQFFVSTKPEQTFATMFGGGAPEYLGYISPLVAAALLAGAVWLRRNRTYLGLGASAVVLVVASLGPDLLYGGHRPGIDLPWKLIESVPVLQDALPDRVTLMADLCLAGMLAIVVDRVLATGSPGIRAAGAGVLVVTAATLVPHALLSAEVASTPAFFRDPAAIEPGSRILVLPYPGGGDTSALRWQAASDLRFAMPGGYFIGPDAHHVATTNGVQRQFGQALTLIAETGAAVAVNAGTRSLVLSDIAYWRVSSIVLGPTGREPELENAVTSFFGPPQSREGVLVWNVPRS